MKLRTVVISVAVVFAVLVAGGFNSPARAADIPPSGLVFSVDGPEKLTLHIKPEPCTSKKVAEHIAPVHYRKLRAAALTWKDGNLYESCWVEQRGLIYSIDEEGAPLQPIPVEQFVQPGV